MRKREQHKPIQIIVIMGNQQCNQCKDGRVETYAYGAHELITQQNELYAVIEKLVDSCDTKVKKVVQAQLETRKNIKNLHLARLYSYELKDEGYGFKAIMHYEYIPKTLRDRCHELQARAQEFSERELFSLIYGVEAGLLELAKSNIHHNCLNLDTIMCKNNIYKITDVSSTTYLTSYELTVKGNRQQFLNERLLGNLFNKSLIPQYELKDDLFSLGMIGLSLAAQRPCEYYYEWTTQSQATLKLKSIEGSLKQLQRKYSSKLVKKIKWLIYEADNNAFEEESNLTEDLLQLDEEMTRVLNRVKKAGVKQKGVKSMNQTTAGTPEKTLRSKVASMRTTSNFQP